MSTFMVNVDQTLLPFTFTDGLTYEIKGTKTVWVQGRSSGLDKHQCTCSSTDFVCRWCSATKATSYYQRN